MGGSMPFDLNSSSIFEHNISKSNDTLDDGGEFLYFKLLSCAIKK